MITPREGIAWPARPQHLLHCLCRLPVQAISLDFLGVPGSALGCKTADLIKQHGFPKDKRLGAGVVDGRSVYSDGAVPAALVASLLKQAGCCGPLPLFWHPDLFPLTRPGCCS